LISDLKIFQLVKDVGSIMDVNTYFIAKVNPGAKYGFTSMQYVLQKSTVYTTIAFFPPKFKF